MVGLRGLVAAGKHCTVARLRSFVSRVEGQLEESKSSRRVMFAVGVDRVVVSEYLRNEYPRLGRKLKNIGVLRMTQQQALPFRSAIPARPKLVTLGSADRIERQRCVDLDIEFPPSMLEDTRCQRMGVSRGYFDGLFRLDRNRELADEECILRSDDWEYEACTWVNWPRATAIGKATAKAFQGAYADFVESRMKQPEQPVTGRQSKRG